MTILSEGKSYDPSKGRSGLTRLKRHHTVPKEDTRVRKQSTGLGVFPLDFGGSFEYGFKVSFVHLCFVQFRA